MLKKIQDAFLKQNFSNVNKSLLLSNFIKIRNGYAFKSSELTENDEIPVIKISNIGNEKTFSFTHETEDKLSFMLYPNYIVIALSRATAGKISQVTNKYSKYYQNQRVGYLS